MSASPASLIADAEDILLTRTVLSADWAHRLARAVQKARSWDASTSLSDDAFRALAAMLCSANPGSNEAERLSQALLAAVHGSEVGRRAAATEGSSLPQALLRIMAEGTSRGRAHAAGALSQIVLAGPDATALCCEQPGFLQGITMHCVHGEDSEKNQSAILVNNCAAVGGPSICMAMAMHSGLIGALKSLLLHGEEPQRSRAAGAFMLLSHSASARQHLLRGGVDDSLEYVALEPCDATEQSLMLRGISCMALVNLTAGQAKKDDLHQALIPVILEFLDAAITSRPLHGMLWRPDDAMWALQALASVDQHHSTLLNTGALNTIADLVRQHLDDSNQLKISSCCEELLLDTLASLAKSRACAAQIRQLGIDRHVMMLKEREEATGGWDVAGPVLKEKRERLMWLFEGRSAAVESMVMLVEAVRRLQAQSRRREGGRGGQGVDGRLLLDVLREEGDDDLLRDMRDNCRWLVSSLDDEASARIRSKNTLSIRSSFSHWRGVVGCRAAAERRKARQARMVLAACLCSWGDAANGRAGNEEAQQEEVHRGDEGAQVSEDARQKAHVSGDISGAVCGLVDHLLMGSEDGEQGSKKESMYKAIMAGIAEGIRSQASPVKLGSGSKASPAKHRPRLHASPIKLGPGSLSSPVKARTKSAECSGLRESEGGTSHDKENAGGGNVRVDEGRAKGWEGGGATVSSGNSRRIVKPLGELERRHLAVKKMAQLS